VGLRMSKSFPFRRPVLAVFLMAACTAPNPHYQRVTRDASHDARRDLVGTGAGPGDGVPGTEPPAEDAAATPEDAPSAPDAGSSLDAGPSLEVAPLDTSSRPDLPTSGLIGLWTFDEGAGSEVGDLSGKGNHGTIIGPVDLGTAWQPGKLGRALEIPNVIGLAVSVSPSVSIDAVKNAFSIAAWVKRTTDVGNRNAAILSRQYGANNGELYTLAFVNNALVLWMYRPSGQSASVKATRAAPLNAWIHAAATWDGTTVRLFQDGTMVGIGAYSDPLPVTTNPLLLGNNANQSGLNQPLAGFLDEVRFYDRLLSPAEIAALAAVGGP
jgi:Concanavalin A-like lectin/glucanases superfamily